MMNVPTLVLFAGAVGCVVGQLPPLPQNLSACDPLVPEQCMFPFPNNFWLRDSGVPGRPLLSFSPDTFPTTSTGQTIDPVKGGWNQLDGFSPMASLFAYFPNVTLTSCPRLWDIGASLDTNASCTVIIDTATNTTVPHWVELDHTSDDDYPNGYERAFLIWPAAMLSHSTRYVVAVHGLVDVSGSPIAPSDAFLALRDRLPSTDYNVNARRNVFEDVFGHTTAVGLDRSSLQLAWDFTTANRTTTTERIIYMRDDAIARFPSSGPQYTIDSVQNNVSNVTGRVIQGHFMVPWYLNAPGLVPSVDSRLVIDNTTGLPVFQDFQPVAFTVTIPASSLLPGAAPARMVQYGHGLFGDQDEVLTQYLQEQGDQFGYVYGAVNWLGMSKYDEPVAAIMIATDLTNFPMIPDRMHQGMLNALCLMVLMKTGLAKDPNLIVNGNSVVDTSLRNYDGNSNGGIMGSVFMGLTQDVKQGCLGVGGGPYSLLLPRSRDFVDLFAIIKVRYVRGLDRISLMPALQLLWDRMEPSGYLDSVWQDPLPNTPAHRVIIQYGLADAQVTWLGAHTMARSVGASIFQSNVREGNETLFGFDVVPDSANLTSGSLIMGWDFNMPEVPFINIPPNSSHDTHEMTRRTLTAQAQKHLFYTTGGIVNTCKGPCVNVSMSHEFHESEAGDFPLTFPSTVHVKH